LGSWTPRTEQERENDRALGRRGEEIIFTIEQERVRQRGLPVDRVVWVAATRPAADYDIKSVDDDGEDLFIEVKSTTGRDGRFVWPVAEFQLAIREHQHYVLYRVYEADSETPSWSCFRDPLSLLESGGLYLDINRLTGDLGSLT
jgi:hypothetical protein